MAANGKHRAARGVVDLTARGLSDEQARQVQETIELKQGMRCSGCGRRIGIGMEFTSIDPRADQPVIKLAACSREDCEFMEECREGATVMQMVEYAWPDENGIEAPPAQVIVERNARRARVEAGGDGGQAAGG